MNRRNFLKQTIVGAAGAVAAAVAFPFAASAIKPSREIAMIDDFRLIKSPPLPKDEITYADLRRVAYNPYHRKKGKVRRWADVPLTVSDYYGRSL